MNFPPLTIRAMRYTLAVGGCVLLLLAWVDRPAPEDVTPVIAPEAPPVVSVELDPANLLAVGHRQSVQGDAREADPAAPAELQPPEAPASPAQLHPAEVAAFYEPTKENFDKWVAEMQRADVADLLWKAPGMQDAWQKIQECRAISTFVVEYEDRELERWRNHQNSIPLEQDLGVFMPWLLEKSPDPAALRTLMDEYSRAAIRRIWTIGEDVEVTDDSTPRWALNEGIFKLPYFSEPALLVQSTLTSLETK